MVQAVLCIAFGLFPDDLSVHYRAGHHLAVRRGAGGRWARRGLLSYFRQRSVRYRDSGTLMAAVFYVIIALIAFIFPKVIAGFFSVALGVVLILLAIVNVVRAFGLRAFGSSIWIAVLAAAVAGGYRRRAHRGEPVGCVHDLRARAGRDVRGQRRGRPVHRVVYPRFREESRRDFHAPVDGLCCGASTSRDSAPLGRLGAVQRGESRRAYR